MNDMLFWRDHSVLTKSGRRPRPEAARTRCGWRVRELLAGLTEAESYEYRQAGYLRALEILKGRLPEIDALAHQLFHHRRIAA
jgi:hypothetical protein